MFLWYACVLSWFSRLVPAGQLDHSHTHAGLRSFLLSSVTMSGKGKGGFKGGFKSSPYAKKTADWVCTKCNGRNFRKKSHCHKCGEAKPCQASEPVEVERKQLITRINSMRAERNKLTHQIQEAEANLKMLVETPQDDAAQEKVREEIRAEVRREMEEKYASQGSIAKKPIVVKDEQKGDDVDASGVTPSRLPMSHPDFRPRICDADSPLSPHYSDYSHDGEMHGLTDDEVEKEKETHVKDVDMMSPTSRGIADFNAELEELSEKVKELDDEATQLTATDAVPTKSPMPSAPMKSPMPSAPTKSPMPSVPTKSPKASVPTKSPPSAPTKAPMKSPPSVPSKSTVPKSSSVKPTAKKAPPKLVATKTPAPSTSAVAKSVVTSVVAKSAEAKTPRVTPKAPPVVDLSRDGKSDVVLKPASAMGRTNAAMAAALKPPPKPTPMKPMPSAKEIEERKKKEVDRQVAIGTAKSIVANKADPNGLRVDVYNRHEKVYHDAYSFGWDQTVYRLGDGEWYYFSERREKWVCISMEGQIRIPCGKNEKEEGLLPPTQAQLRKRRSENGGGGGSGTGSRSSGSRGQDRRKSNAKSDTDTKKPRRK